MSEITATEYAYAAGAKFAAYINSDARNNQHGPGRMEPHEEIPEGDYLDMVERFGECSNEMEAAYRRGYNERE